MPNPALHLACAGGVAPQILSILAAQPWSVWWDPHNDYVVKQDDSGTTRITSMLSRPISGQSQHTVSQATIGFSPAVTTTANGRQAMNFAGAQYLVGAATIAANLQGTAAFTAIQVASRTVSATMVRASAGLSSGADNRVLEYVSAAGNVTGRQRNQAGASTQNTGTAMAVSTVYTLADTYAATTYAAWLSGAAETLSGAGANSRAPASLDEFYLGAQRAAGTITSFWTGMIAGTILCGGALASGTRSTLEHLVGTYYGSPF